MPEQPASPGGASARAPRVRAAVRLLLGHIELAGRVTEVAGRGGVAAWHVDLPGHAGAEAVKSDG